MDAHNALGRIQKLFEAESLPDEQVGYVELVNALELDGASFTWDAPPPEAESGRGEAKEVKDTDKVKKGKRPETSASATAIPTPGSIPNSPYIPTPKESENSDKVFRIQKTSLRIPKGKVVAIVGPVGSGKSSLLQGMIGEMRKECGSVKFYGSVSYCPQSAWVQVQLPTPRGIMLYVSQRIIERHYPRERLLRSSFRSRQVLASHFRLVLGFGLEAIPKR